MAAAPASPPGARAKQGLSLPARTALDVAGRAVGAIAFSPWKPGADSSPTAC